MDTDKDKETHEEIVEHEEVSAHPSKSVREQELEAHHGHPPVSHDNLADEEITVQRENLVMPVVLAALVAFFALYGLSVAGNTKPDIKLGQEAYDSIHKVMSAIQKPAQQENTVSPIENMPEGVVTEDGHDHGHGEENSHEH